jgi:hypothetical protein
MLQLQFSLNSDVADVAVLTVPTMSTSQYVALCACGVPVPFPESSGGGAVEMHPRAVGRSRLGRAGDSRNDAVAAGDAS